MSWIGKQMSYSNLAYRNRKPPSANFRNRKPKMNRQKIWWSCKLQKCHWDDKVGRSEIRGAQPAVWKRVVKKKQLQNDTNR